MIYTVTFNPSLDYIISVDGFETGKVICSCDDCVRNAVMAAVNVLDY